MSNSSPQAWWPVEAADGALVLWRDEPCKLAYDAEQHTVRLVHATDPTILYDTIDLDDMIGADVSIDLTSNEPIRAVDSKHIDSEPSVAVDTQAAATLTLYVYPRKDPSSVSLWHKIGLSSYQPQPTPNYVRPQSFATFGPRVPHHRVWRLCPVEDLTHTRTLLAALRALVAISSREALNNTLTVPPPTPLSTPPPPRHYLVLVNPRSGPRRNAVHVAETQLAPLLDQAGIEYTLCVTSHYRHAWERCQTKGAPRTKDTETDPTDQELDLTHYHGIVVMGGDGSLHEVLNGIATRPDAAHIYASIPLGVIGCGTANGLATSLAHAGHDVMGLTTDMFNVAKSVTVPMDVSSYTVYTPETKTIHPYTSFLTFTWAIIAEVDIESERIHWVGHRRYDIWAVVRVLFLRKYRATFSYQPLADDAAIPSVEDPVPSSWTTIDDDIVLFWATQVTHPGRTTYLSPQTHVGDGVFTILLVRGNVSRLRLALILLGLETGSHETMPGAEWIQCSAYRLHGSGSFNDLDGEVIEKGPIQGQVMPKAVRVFASSTIESS